MIIYGTDTHIKEHLNRIEDTMKKDRAVKRIIQYRNKELRTRLFRLSPFWWAIIIFLIAVLLLVLSFLVYDLSNWASGALVSTSCGCFTGLVFYFLSNIRNNKIAKLQKEYKQLKDVLDVIKNITNIADYYKFKALYGGKRDIFYDRDYILLGLNDLEATRNQLPIELYDILFEQGYDPADRDNINSYRESLYSSNQSNAIESSMINIHKELLPLADKLQELYREREDQLMLMGRHFF